MPDYLIHFFDVIDNYHDKNTRSKSKNTLILPKWENEYGKRTFKYRSVKLWNDLSSDIRSIIHSLTLQSFKNIIS